MKIIKEAVVYTSLIFILCGIIYSEGQKTKLMESRIGLPVLDLYKKLSRSQSKLQIIDVRQNLSDYEDTHLPGAIPMPNCQFENLPASVAGQIFSYIPTIIVSEDGNTEAFSRCIGTFKTLQNLKGGIKAWVDENLPEDSGEYSPPRPTSGGGCL